MRSSRQWGAEATLVATRGRDLHSAIPGSTLAVLSGLGHECYLEFADTFDAEVRRFLLAQPSGGGDTYRRSAWPRLAVGVVGAMPRFSLPALLPWKVLGWPAAAMVERRFHAPLPTRCRSRAGSSARPDRSSTQSTRPIVRRMDRAV